MICHYSNMLGQIARYACLVMMASGLSAGCNSDSRLPEAVRDQAADSVTTTDAAPLPDSSATSTLREQVPVAAPSPSEPVTASMIIRPESANGGDTVEVLVLVRIARAHYLHADNSHQPFTAVAMNLTLPEELQAVSDWRFPTPEKARDNSLVYRDTVTLRRSLRIRSIASPKILSVAGELRYQACNDELCWPPGTLDLSTSLAIKQR